LLALSNSERSLDSTRRDRLHLATMETFDVAIVGAGPAGSSCAAFCSLAGLRTLVLERETFPREKVCGDCLNPSSWPVLDRLDLVQRVRTLPHAKLGSVEFIAISGRRVIIDLSSGEESEIAIKRSLFDMLLMSRARELGTQVYEETTVTALTSNNGWTIETARGATFAARTLVGADGRNSTVARLCNLLPRPARERVALQAHIPLPPGFGDRIVLQFLSEGYSGQAPVNHDELNLCLVSNPSKLPALRHWAEKQFGLQQDHQWHTITPLTRAALAPARDKLFLVGDAARVVEPFTGEGIYYALRSAELAAQAIVKVIRGNHDVDPASEYAEAHAAIYRGRLWINRLARAAVLSPRITSFLIHAARTQPILRSLTAKIVTPQL
jgi:geranylgeranyl reductase family protein